MQDTDEEIKVDAPVMQDVSMESEEEKGPQEAIDIQFVRKTRREIVKELTKKGMEEVVNDPKKMAALLTTLTDMDRTSIQRVRVKVETNNAAAGSANAQLIAKALSGIRGVVNYSLPDENGQHRPAPMKRETPTLPDSIPTKEFSDANRKVGTVNDTYDGFQQRNGDAPAK